MKKRSLQLVASYCFLSIITICNVQAQSEFGPQLNVQISDYQVKNVNHHIEIDEKTFANPFEINAGKKFVLNKDENGPLAAMEKRKKRDSK